MSSLCRRHVKKLKDSYLSEKVARYLSLLPEVNIDESTFPKTIFNNKSVANMIVSKKEITSP